MEKKICAFFGHRDCPETVKSQIRQAVVDLIENHKVTMFYVGNQGNFDCLVLSVLKETTTAYPGVEYAVVLAYMPSAKSQATSGGYLEAILPEGVELGHRRFAIPWRNKWMIDHADYVVTYVTRSYGGAAKAMNQAIKSGKIIYSITQECLK